MLHLFLFGRLHGFFLLFCGAFTDHSNSKQTFSFYVFILFSLIIWFYPKIQSYYVYLYFMSLSLYNPNLGVGIMPFYILHNFLCGVLDKGVQELNSSLVQSAYSVDRKLINSLLLDLMHIQYLHAYQYSMNIINLELGCNLI